MKTAAFSAFMVIVMSSATMSADRPLESDTFSTPEGEITITFIGHGTLMLKAGSKVIHVDPWSNLADYSRLPDADLILITHEHRDHLDDKAIKEIRRKDTVIL